MDYFNKVKSASIWGIIGNIFLFIIKGIIGFITSSKAMIADTFNSAGDILSSLMTFIGNKISSKKADEDHNLGHGKAEYIYSMLISVVMILTCLFIIKDATILLFKPVKLYFNIGLIIVCIITIITKFSLYIYTNKLAKKYNNILLKANSKDHINDCLITFINLISCYLSIINVKYVDSIAGIIIAAIIIYSYIKIFIESYDVLMDKCMNEDDKNKVLEIIKNYPEIIKVNHFNSTPVGYKYQISLTIYVDGNLKTFESHAIADKLEKEIINKIKEIYLVVIHVNPIKIKDN